MRTSDTCLLSDGTGRGTARAAAAGFTLVEILVVLVIVGMIAGVAFPRLLGVYASVENASQLNAIRDEIEGLGYRAFSTGKPIVLETSNADKEAKDYPLKLPAGWRIELAKPLRYTSRGVCDGGKVTITNPRGGSETFQLSPPFCVLVPVDANAL